MLQNSGSGFARSVSIRKHGAATPIGRDLQLRQLSRDSLDLDHESLHRLTQSMIIPPEFSSS
jgi:hypothetical protein